MRTNEKKLILVVGLVAMALVIALTQMWPSTALADDDDDNDGRRRGRTTESSSNSDNDDDDDKDKKDKKDKKDSNNGNAAILALLTEMQAQSAADKAELLARIGELETELSTLITQQPNTLSQELAAHDADIDAAIAALSSQLADHDEIIAGDLPPGGGAIGTALAALSGQVAGIETNIGSAIAAGNSALSSDVFEVFDLVHDTHTVDPFDMSVTVCANSGGFATFDQDASFASDFGFGPFIGADFYGNGGTADYRGHFANTLNSAAGASTGVTLNACLDGIIVRQDGTVDANPLSDLNVSELQFITENLGNETDLADLRAQITRSALFDMPLSALQLTDSIAEVAAVDLNLLNTFRIVNDDLGALEDTLPLPPNVARDFPNSPIPASMISMDPLSICTLPGIEILDNGGSNPIQGICDSAGEGKLLTDAITSISDTLNPAIDRIETRVDKIDGTADKISASVGNNLRDIAVRIREIVNSICSGLGC